MAEKPRSKLDSVPAPHSKGGNGLTPKQEAFVRAYIETGSQAGAYRLAYDAEGMKDNTIYRKAYGLLENGKVRARLAELKAERDAKLIETQAVSVASLTGELNSAIAIATEGKQAGAIVQAILAKAKLHRLIVDERINRNISEEAAAISDDDLKEKVWRSLKDKMN